MHHRLHIERGDRFTHYEWRGGLQVVGSSDRVYANWPSSLGQNSVAEITFSYFETGNQIDVTAAGPLIATIRVNYKDGSTDTIYTDTTWKILSSVPPAGWTSPSFDDSKWGTPVVKLAGSQTPWGRPWAYPPAIDMDPAQTIWTDEVKNGVAPVGHRAFRTTITSPYGKAAVCGKMVIDADNNYTLYVNGNYLGHGGDWHTMQAYSVPILDPDVNVIAVDGENGVVSPGSTQPNAAIVVAATVIAYNDGSFATFYTSKNWKAVHSVPSGFEEKDYDDGSWMAASEYGIFATSSYKSATTIPRA